MINLNSGTHSITAPSVLKAKFAFEKQFETNPTFELLKMWGYLWKQHVALAKFLAIKPEDIVLRRDLTAAMNLVLMSLKLSPKENVVTTDVEYGAVFNVAKLKTEMVGATLKQASFAGRLHQMRDDEIVRRILSSVDSQTRAVLVSGIVTATGQVMPCHLLSKALGELPSKPILVIDGAHALGTIEYTLDGYLAQNVIYVGNLHKWLCGAKGSAFAWIPTKLQSHFTPYEAGWTTYEVLPPFDEFKGTPLTRRMLCSASGDFSSWMSIEEMVKLWSGSKRLKWQKDLKQRGKWLRDAMAKQERPLKLLTPLKSIERGSPLMCYELSAFQEDAGVNIMKEICEKIGVQVSITKYGGKNWLRLSPHVYNSKAEIEKGLDKLVKYLSLA